jgi:ribosomal protein S18 acetylase RimI-like enzyme
VVEYKINSATLNDLLLHLELCNSLFIPPLNSKVDLSVYAQKIFNNALLVEAWKQNDLIGLIAAYFNDIQNDIGFITNVSVVQEYNNQGVAKELLSITKQYATEHHFNKIKLEVHPENEKALRFYSNNNFKIITKESNSIIMELSLKINANE